MKLNSLIYVKFSSSEKDPTFSVIVSLWAKIFSFSKETKIITESTSQSKW
jgi:hypothetical protein